MHRSVWRKLLVVLFALLALDGFAEATRHFLSPTDVPPALFWLQLVAGSLALASAVGLWRRARWGSVVIIAWGIEVAAMLVLLAPILDLDAQASAGLWPGAGVMLVIAALCAWYAQRTCVDAASARHDSRYVAP
jgi:peptidoglycan/LPS O-acetylase OafA/YrhL